MIAPQGRDDGGLGWLFQLVAVFVFFVLPVLRSIAETRKKARAGQAARAPKAPRPPAQRSGRDLWRDLLEGRVEPPAAPPSAPVRRPKAASAPIQPQVARPPLESLESLESVPPALAPRVEDTRLEVSIAPRASELAAPELDPATLDDELVSRWQAAAATTLRAEPAPVLGAHLGGGDWRRAVLLSELLAPPLALRGPASAWPGPPASLSA